MNLKDFASIALDVEKDCKEPKICECCGRHMSAYLYLVKSAIYGVFHICSDCKIEIEKLPRPVESTAFVQKAFSTFE